MRIFLVALLFAFTACQQQTPPVAEAVDTAAIEAAITETVNGVISAAEAADKEQLNDYWLANYMGASQGVLINRDGLFQMFDGYFSSIESQEMNLTNSQIDVLSADLALMSAEGVFTATTKDGVTTPQQAFSWTYVFAKQDDGAWKILQSHQSFGAVISESASQ